MTDQCMHCVVKGDYEKCLEIDCFHHENWINKKRIGIIAKLEEEKEELQRALLKKDVGILTSYQKLQYDFDKMHDELRQTRTDAIVMAELVIEGDESLASFTVFGPEDFESTKEALEVIKKYKGEK